MAACGPLKAFPGRGCSAVRAGGLAPTLRRDLAGASLSRPRDRRFSGLRLPLLLCLLLPVGRLEYPFQVLGPSSCSFPAIRKGAFLSDGNNFHCKPLTPISGLSREPALGQKGGLVARDGDLTASQLLSPVPFPRLVSPQDCVLGIMHSASLAELHKVSLAQARGPPGGLSYGPCSALGNQGRHVSRPEGNTGCSCCLWETLTPRPLGSHLCPSPRPGTHGPLAAVPM